jgi:hypothetical protein
MRKVILEVVDERSSAPSMQADPILREAASRLGIRREPDLEEALLTIWYDLFRTGYLAWGHNLLNPNPPHFHLTAHGRTTLQSLSRDPANPDGYLAHLSSIGALTAVARSYLEEGLNTYILGCFKAAAVMIGAATESVVLELRDALTARIQTLGRSPSNRLTSWKISAILGAIQTELDKQKPKMPRSLSEAFDSYWPAFTQQIRAARNASGHPTSIDPVTPDTVHASLLIFPETLRLALDLKQWIGTHYT